MRDKFAVKLPPGFPLPWLDPDDANGALLKIADALESTGWTYDQDSHTWFRDNLDGLTFAEAVVQELEVAARSRK